MEEENLDEFVEVWDVRVCSSCCGAHCDVVHSPFEWFYLRRHCHCRDPVLFVGRLLAERPLGAARVLASRCRVVVVLLLVVLTILFGTVGSR